jgi:hypothetical protein
MDGTFTDGWDSSWWPDFSGSGFSADDLKFLKGDRRLDVG